MPKTLELLEAAKARSGFTSDYRLAQVLEVHASNIVSYRKGASHPKYDTVMRLAELAGTDPDAAWLGVCVERASSTHERAAWLRIGERLKALDTPRPTH